MPYPDIHDCRLCGGEGQYRCLDGLYPHLGPEPYRVECEDCANEGPLSSSLEGAIVLWNLANTKGADV